MGSFEVLAHTADVGFRATAPTAAELFETAAVAMFSIEYDPASVAVTGREFVEATADDLAGLMEVWLSELLWLHDAEGFVPAAVHVDEVVTHGSPLRIAGAAEGSSIGDWFVQTGPQLKAVTLHGLEVRLGPGGWEATVYLDV